MTTTKGGFSSSTWDDDGDHWTERSDMDKQTRLIPAEIPQTLNENTIPIRLPSILPDLPSPGPVQSSVRVHRRRG